MYTLQTPSVFKKTAITQALLSGGAQPFLSLKQIGEIKIPIPLKDEQRAIAVALSDVDAEIAALEARRDKTRDLKQGMMQELLTGRITLVGGKA
jgi:type I restriction enzyme S subunit